MNTYIKQTLLLLITCLLINCKSSKQVKTFNDKDIRFSLSKGACFGTCPIYELKIYHGGHTTFLGKQNTDNLGQYDKMLSSKEYKNIEKAFEKLDFDKYPDYFDSRIPDLPMIKIGYHNGKQLRVVSGKEERPEDLMQVQFLLEKIVDNKQWNLVKGLKELNKDIIPEPTYIYNEIIIEPKKGLLLSKWLESNSKYGVRLIKKIAPALNYYLIGFDTKKVAPKEFLNILHKDSQIKVAEFNKKTNPRNRD
jgi:hypothetical protein